MITLGELLQPRGLDMSKRTKILRHQDKRIDLGRLLRRDRSLFEVYQADQGKPVFTCDQLLSFVKTEHGTLFAGGYNVLGCARGSHPRNKEVDPFCDPGQRLFSNRPEEGGYIYDLRPIESFADLQGRVVINWGSGNLAWHQNYKTGNDKEVAAILPFGYVTAWPGYLDILVDRLDIQQMARCPQANRHWIDPLTAISGIYLIQQRRTGDLYIGSATGARGIWGRWEAYAANGHGGNAQLKRRVEEDPAYADELCYSILHVLPRNMALTEIYGYESLYKKKLGSRAFGLNSN